MQHHILQLTIRTLLSIAVIIALGLFSAVSTSAVELQVQAEYQTPEGVQYKSYSTKWETAQKLQQLHNELKQNTHGNELYHLSLIEIFPDYPDRTRTRTGTYTLAWEMQDGTPTVVAGSTIQLFGGDTLTSIQELARPLAIEYGKHFTQYHILTQEKIALTSQLRTQTEYYRLRNLSNYERFGTTGQWDILRIAAHDYVQIFGSANARRIVEFTNMIDFFDQNPTTWQQIEHDRMTYNALPQDNLILPLASQVDGLAEYFCQLLNNANEASRSTCTLQSITAAPQLRISAIRQINEQSNSIQLQFSWNSITDSLNRNLRPVSYTIVTYNVNDAVPYPIATYSTPQHNDNIFNARYGAASARFEGKVYFNKHVGFYGEKAFRVFAIAKNGQVVSSNIITVNLSRDPIQINDNTLIGQDINYAHWAYNDFIRASSYGFINGYPDGSVRPENIVTRAEMLTMLLRVFQFNRDIVDIDDIEKIVSNNHWADNNLNRAIHQRIIKADYYGTNYNLFHMDRSMTRDETAMIISSILKRHNMTTVTKDSSLYSDISGNKYSDYILHASSYGILQGFTDGSFRPLEPVTRAQAATITNNLFRTIQ